MVLKGQERGVEIGDEEEGRKSEAASGGGGGDGERGGRTVFLG